MGLSRFFNTRKTEATATHFGEIDLKPIVTSVGHHHLGCGERTMRYP